jgi:outer membrane receptor protein involved in Fe transport
VNAGLRWRGADGLTVNVEATHQAASNSEYVSQTDAGAPNFGQVIGVRRGDAATLVNASLQYRFGRWVAGAHVRNLLDRDYLVSRPSGTVVTSGAPRGFGASLRFDL